MESEKKDCNSGQEIAKAKCHKCGQEYFLPDSKINGLCGRCKPGFFGFPLWFEPIEAGTKSLWRTVIVIHVILLLFFSSLMDTGEVSVPGGIYCLTVIIYLLTRFVIAHFKGYPILTKAQAAAFMLLPLYGPIIAISLFHLGQYIQSLLLPLYYRFIVIPLYHLGQ